METSSHKKYSVVKSIADVMDSKFQGPFGFRFGLDGILGLIPFYGDFVTSLFSYYIVVAAAQAGCSPIVLIRMAMNIIIEDVVGLIPLVGNIFDFVWKSNNKNVKLFERYLQSPSSTSRSSSAVVAAVIVMIIAIQAAFFYLAYKVTVAIFHAIQSMG